MLYEVITEGIRGAGERGAALIGQLLTFSRKKVLHPKVVDLNRMLTGIDVMLRRLVGESIDVAVIRTGDLGNVRVDPGQIDQVILNLAANARDAMPGGGTLTIETVITSYSIHYTKLYETPGSG